MSPLSANDPQRGPLPPCIVACSLLSPHFFCCPPPPFLGSTSSLSSLCSWSPSVSSFSPPCCPNLSHSVLISLPQDTSVSPPPTVPLRSSILCCFWEPLRVAFNGLTHLQTMSPRFITADGMSQQQIFWRTRGRFATTPLEEKRQPQDQFGKRKYESRWVFMGLSMYHPWVQNVLTQVPQVFLFFLSNSSDIPSCPHYFLWQREAGADQLSFWAQPPC